MDVDDDEEMRAAIALSLQTVQPDAAAAKPTEEPVDAMDEDDDELAKALAMSKTTSAPTQSTPKDEKSEAKGGDAPVDSNSMAQMLLGLPGMDPNDPEVQVCSAQLSFSCSLVTFHMTLGAPETDEEREQRQEVSGVSRLPFLSL